jgi:hypothetical protein
MIESDGFRLGNTILVVKTNHSKAVEMTALEAVFIFFF